MLLLFVVTSKKENLSNKQHKLTQYYIHNIEMQISPSNDQSFELHQEDESSPGTYVKRIQSQHFQNSSCQHNCTSLL